ncbi:MAG: DUF2974 domain-containing protein [Clostridia bacterium]|nr:DUF2974 domain-containing protein [Clostridia bacterium]
MKSVFKRISCFLLSILLICTVMPFAVSQNYDYLVGEWETSAGDVNLKLNSDQTYELNWTGFPKDEGNWYTEAESDEVCRISFDGNGILNIMAIMYGINDANYHFEALKIDADNFYLVQVYGNYTAYSSPCKLGLTRVGGTQNRTSPKEPITVPEIEDEGDLKEIDVELMREDKPNYQTQINWGWEYFLRLAKDYNHELAKASLIISQSLYDREHFKEKLYNEFGFEDIEYLPSASFYMPGYAFAHKELTVGESTKHVILVAVRGTMEILEWVNDFSSVISGFRPDTEYVNDALQEYIKKIGCTKSDTILYCTGHSYGGAIAQSLAPFAENYVRSDNHCFIYTFAAPNTLVDFLKSREFLNVHNIINDNDCVPFLSPNYMKYGRQWHYNSNDEKFQSSFDSVYSEKGWQASGAKENHDCATYFAMMLRDLPQEKGQEALPYSYISVHCPVDVTVKDLQGNVMVNTKGADVLYENGCNIQVFNDGENKDIFVPSGVLYQVEITGTGEGTMQVKHQSVDVGTNQVRTQNNYPNIAVHPGEQFSLRVDSAQTEDLQLQNITTGETYSGEEAAGSFPWLYIIIAVVVVIVAVEIIALIWLLKKRKKEAKQVEQHG